MQAVLEELLLQSRLVDAARVRRAKEVASGSGRTLAHTLVTLGLVSDRALASLLSSALKLRVVDLERINVDAHAVAALAGPVAHRLRVLPIRLRSTPEGELLFLAMSDPTDSAAVLEVEALTGRRVMPAVAEERALELALGRHFANEALQPLERRHPSDLDELSEPPLVVGTLDIPPTDPLGEGRDEDVRAQLLANDSGYLTESTDDVMLVYAHAIARGEGEAEGEDLLWLEERRGQAGDDPAKLSFGDELTEPELPHPSRGPFDDE